MKNAFVMNGAIVLAMGLSGCGEDMLQEESPTVVVQIQEDRMERRLETLETENPENWDEMNIGEKMEFMQMHTRPQRGRGGEGPNLSSI